MTASTPTETTPLRSAVRQAARFDREKISWPAGLLAAIPVMAMLGGALAAGQPVAAATMAAGAMLVGTAWRVSGGRPPLAVMATDALFMALSTFVGCVSGEITGAHVPVLAVWSLMGGLLVGLGNRGGAIGTQSVIAAVVFGRFPEPAPQALGLAGLVLAGGMAQVVFLTVVRWPPPLRVQRAAAAQAYRALARLATGTAGTSALPAATALDEAEASLASGSLFGDPSLMTLRSLADEGHRLRVGLTAINGLAGRLDPDTEPGRSVHALGPDARRALELAADAIEHPDAAEELERVSARFTDGVAALVHNPPLPADELPRLWPALARRLSGLASQLRAVASLAPAAGTGGRLRSRRPQPRTARPLQRLRGDLAQLRANISLQSPATRHALRLAVVVPLASLLSRELPLQRGYWMVVAAATVLRPEYGATFTRGTERALGTTLGVTLAGLIAVGLQPAETATVVLVGAFAWLAYATFPASFAVGYAFITALVVFLLNALNPDTLATVTARFVDTLVGGALGLLVFAVWPTWARGSARASLARLIDAQRAYLRAVLGVYADGSRISDRQARPLARAARRARTAAEANVARSLSEPPARRLDPRLGEGALSAMRRLIQATHVLRLDAADERIRAAGQPIGELRPLADAVDTLLGAVAVTIRDGGALPAAARARLIDAREHLEAPGIADHPELRAQLDEIVDAATGVADLVRRAPAPRAEVPEPA